MGVVMPPAIKNKICDVKIKPLKQIVDDRGKLSHMLRSDSEMFSKFGEIYFLKIFSGKIKAWKRHLKMTQRMVAPVGKILLALYDDREKSSTKGTVELIKLGQPDTYYLVTIPPLIWYGFKGIANESSLIANCPDMPHDDMEVESIPFDDESVPFSWLGQTENRVFLKRDEL